MSTCSVHTVWALATKNVDVAARDRQFLDQIIPSVQGLPGYVHGVWARSTDGSRGYNTIVFDDRRNAEGLLAQIEDNMPQSAAAGVQLESLEVMDVIASS